MRSIYFMALANLSFASGAFAQHLNPIDYRVLDNNRLFLGADAGRYAEDLRTYLSCMSSGNTQPSAECVKYREDGRNGSDQVPNLRRGNPGDAYRIRYNQHVHAHPADYVLDGTRRLEFFIDPQSRATARLKPKLCKWTIGETDLPTTSCEAASHEVTLSASPDGSSFEHVGSVKVQILEEDGVTATFSRSFVTRDFLIVSMGDSFTAGEGNPSYNLTNSSPAEWMDYRCHRSAFSYPTIAASALALLDPHHSITLVHVACSGAESTAGLRLPYVGAVNSSAVAAYRQSPELVSDAAVDSYHKEFERLPAQISQVSALLRSAPDGRRERRPDLAVMSIGVNDMGIAAFLEMLALEDVHQETPRDGCPPTDELGNSNKTFETSQKDRLSLSGACLDNRLRAVRTEFESKMEPRSTFLMSYIDPITNEAGDVCGADNRITLLDGYKTALFFSGVRGAFRASGALISGLPNLTYAEMNHAKRAFVAPLLKTLGNTAPKNGWEWIPYNSENLEGRRGFCAAPSWYHSYRASHLRQGADPGTHAIAAGTLHPNTFGQYFAAVRLLARLRSRAGLLADHHIHALSKEDFEGEKDAKQTKYNRGFAWHVWDWGSDPANLGRYYRH